MKRIPKIIHQIWIGKGKKPAPLPEKCAAFVARMKELHPEWEVTLHGNELWERYTDDPFLKAYRARETCREAHIANRLRFLLLRDFGGIYADVDVEPLLAFDSFLNEVATASLVIGLLPPGDRKRVVADITVLAARAGSKAVEKVLGQAYETPRWAPGGKPLAEFILDNLTPDQRVVSHRYWFSKEANEDAIALHTPHRLRSWV